jgi:hypothetical protein
MRHRRAELVFIEDSAVRNDERMPGELLGSWHGRPLNAGNTVDMLNGEFFGDHGRFICSIKAEVNFWGDSVRFHTVRQARAMGGRRYDDFATLTEAQESLISWFKRNFRLATDDERGERDDRERNEHGRHMSWAL